MGLEELPFQHRILLIEDDNVSLFAASEILSRLTAMVDMARDVEEATDQLNRVAYDLVISDISLPDGSGMDIIRYARTHADSKNKTTPFVALTAYDSKQKYEEIWSCGFLEVMSKPLSAARVHSFLSRCSSNKNDRLTPSMISLKELNAIVPESSHPAIEDLAIIDLRLGLERMSARNDEKAVIGIGLLIDSLHDDIHTLKALYVKDDLEGVQRVLHKIKGALDYSGVPRLQQCVKVLYAALKDNVALLACEPLFEVVYEQVQVLTAAYQDLLVHRRGIASSQ